METSIAINELAAALAKAQGKITGALKDSANPFFKSKYADLASCWDACRAPLSDNGLSVIQMAETMDSGALRLVTTLAHESGQWMRGEFWVTPKDDTPQALGSALTYARRYALTALVGIAQVDDDGNAGSGRSNGNAYPEPHTPGGDLGRGVPSDKATACGKEMQRIMNISIDGDHDELRKAMGVLDYHEKVLNPDPDLYEAAGRTLNAANRNAWKSYITKARAAEKADAASAPTNGRRF